MAEATRARSGRRHPHLDGAVRRTVLPSGTQVVTETMRSSQTYSLGVFAAVGSRHESPALHGASHFLEHVLFKGTPRRSAEQISAAIESVGGELNAYTAKEHTCFYARVLHQDAAVAVDVLTDMVTASRVRSADVDAERAVILDEIAMHADDPGELVTELVHAALFAGSTLGQPVIGSPGSIAAMTRRQVVQHWRRHYQPASLVVAAAGRVDHDELVQQLAVLAESRPPAEGPRPARSPAATRAPVSGELVTRQIRLEQCSAMLAFGAPGVFDDARYAQGLLAVVVGGGMASRLFVEVRERRGLTYGIDAGETTYSDAGVWSVDWQCAPDKVAEIGDLVRQILGEVAEHGVTDDELARAKGQIAGQTVLSYESPSSRMSRLGANALIGDARSLDDLIGRYEAVTLEQVRAAAQQLFACPPVIGVVGPRVPRRRLEALLGRW